MSTAFEMLSAALENAIANVDSFTGGKHHVENIPQPDDARTSQGVANNFGRATSQGSRRVVFELVEPRRTTRIKNRKSTVERLWRQIAHSHHQMTEARHENVLSVRPDKSRHRRR